MKRFLSLFSTKTLLKFLLNFKSVFGFPILLGSIFGMFSAFVLSQESSQIISQNHKQSFDFLPSSTTNQIVKHNYYSLSYCEKYEQAEWVAYELKKSYVRNSNFDRPYFIEDPKVKTR